MNRLKVSWFTRATQAQPQVNTLVNNPNANESVGARNGEFSISLRFHLRLYFKRLNRKHKRKAMWCVKILVRALMPDIHVILSYMHDICALPSHTISSLLSTKARASFESVTSHFCPRFSVIPSHLPHKTRTNYWWNNFSITPSRLACKMCGTTLELNGYKRFGGGKEEVKTCSQVMTSSTQLQN